MSACSVLASGIACQGRNKIDRLIRLTPADWRLYACPTTTALIRFKGAGMQATAMSPNWVHNVRPHPLPAVSSTTQVSCHSRNCRRSSSGTAQPNQHDNFGGVHEEAWLSRNGVDLSAGSAAGSLRPECYWPDFGRRGGCRPGALVPGATVQLTHDLSQQVTQICHRVERLFHFYRPRTGHV